MGLLSTKMKFLLIAAFVALAVAGGCTELVNADFADDNTVEPWLTVSYNRGSDFCRRWNTPNNPETCALLQQNAFNGRDNAGRISVGSNERPACRYEDEAMQGMNVYQTNIGMCEGYRVTARIGTQDNRFAANNEGTPFATVVNSCGSYPIEYSADGTTTNDVTDFNFRNGKNAVEACVVSDTYSNAQDASPTNKDCCSFYIGFNLCCEWTYTTGDKKRSAAP